MSDYWYPTNLISVAEMPVTKKKCVNDDQFTYTGKEASPLGLGHTASKYVVGDRMKGRDDTVWMVAKKNDVNVWVRVPSENLTKDTPVIPVADPHVNDDEADVKPAPAAAPVAAPKKKAASKPKKEKVKIQEEVVNLEPVAEEAEAEEEAEAAEAAEAAEEEAEEEAAEEEVKVVVKKVSKPKAADKAKAANAGEPKTKKVSEYNLFVKLQTELAKVDPATKDMDGKARFRYVSQRASELWKTMDAAAKTAAVANVKMA